MNKILSAILLVALHTLALRGEVTSLINYQSKIKKHGTNEQGSVDLVFRVYTGPTNLTCIYQESQQVEVKDGLLSTLIGKNPTLGDIGEACKLDDAYLEVEINGNKLKPREKFTPPPFSKRSVQSWRLFALGYDPFGSLYQQGSAYLNPFNVPQGEFVNQSSAIFPMPAETTSLSSAKVLWLQLEGYANGANGVEAVGVAASATLVATDFISQNQRQVGSETFFYSTNTPTKAWLPLQLSTNANDLIIQPTEFLTVNFKFAHFSPVANGGGSGSYILDVRVK
jgi:hypothetical protein